MGAAMHLKHFKVGSWEFRIDKAGTTSTPGIDNVLVRSGKFNGKLFQSFKITSNV
jgi:hypothetical protein